MDVLDRAYTKKLASGIRSITVNSTNDGLYFETNSGASFDIKLPEFHEHLNKAVLDKFSFDNTNNQLLYDGKPIIVDVRTYVEEITTTSSVWSVQHNLHTKWYELSINIIDSDNNIVFGDIDVSNSTNNLLVIKFNTPIAGKIIIKK